MQAKNKTQSDSLAGSWFASPALAGIISIGVFILIRKFILDKVNRGFFRLLRRSSIVSLQEDQLTLALRWLPVFYGVTIMINVFSILLSAPPRSCDR